MEGTLPILFLDGGLGTSLESTPYNVTFDSAKPLWSSHLLISSPNTLLEVHNAFAKVGADVILTATYQASFEGFAATLKETANLPLAEVEGEKSKTKEKQEVAHTHGEEEARELMRSAIPLVNRAFAMAVTDGKVALSLGAYGATMIPSAEYSGDYKPEEMRNVGNLARWHGRRLRTFRDDSATWQKVDFVAFETLPVVHEIRAVREIMSRFNTGADEKKWWISCVFPNEDLCLPDGTTVDKVVDTMIGSETSGLQQPWGIGINCTSVDKLEPLVLQFERAVERNLQGSVTKGSSVRHGWPWLVVYPNGAQGLIYNTESQTWDHVKQTQNEEPTKPWDQEVADVIKQVRKRGLWPGILVGGCCKTTPDDIARLRTRLIDPDLYDPFIS